MAGSQIVNIIGIGQGGLKGLTDAARELVDRADLLIGEHHALALVPDTGKSRLVVGTSFDEAARQIEDAGDKRVVVLAVGDPLFYGVARYLCDKLGKQRFHVVPHVSTMQLAFARVRESWEEAFLTNLAHHDVQSVLDHVRSAEKVGLFTSDEFPPAIVAKTLLDRGLDYFTAYVCENLGSPDERVTQGELGEIAGQEFGPLNVMILVRRPNSPDRPADAIGKRLFGNPDEAFLQSKPKRGLLTPSEIRSMALAEMDLGPASIVWDVGSGSGSLAVEAARIAASGTSYAIERDPEDYELINRNATMFGVTNLVSILGRAPDAWKNLPDPDSIFVGGSGREMSVLINPAYQRLKVGGRLVTTMGSVQTLTEVHRVLHGYSSDVKVWMVNLARGNYQLERIRFESLNPTFLVAVVKPG